MSQQPEKKKTKKLHASTLHVLSAAFVLALTCVVLTYCSTWATYQIRIEAEAEADEAARLAEIEELLKQ